MARGASWLCSWKFDNRRYAWAHRRQALRAYEKWTRDLPDDLSSILTFMVPPAIWEMGAEPQLMIGFAWAGDSGGGEAEIDRLRVAAPPNVEVVEPVIWTQWQSSVDELFPSCARAYWKNVAFDELDDDVVNVLLRRAAE